MTTPMMDTLELKFNFHMVQGKNGQVNLLKLRKVINGEIICSLHTKPFINTQEYEVDLYNDYYHELTPNTIVG